MDREDDHRASMDSDSRDRENYEVEERKREIIDSEDNQEDDDNN